MNLDETTPDLAAVTPHRPHPGDSSLPDIPSAAHIGGSLDVWFEADVQLIVFYDFENDQGLSMNLDEWRRALVWSDAAGLNEPSEGTLDQRIPADLLVALHAAGVAWQASESVLLRSWGRHLLEDWRSLELLAERHRQ